MFTSTMQRVVFVVGMFWLLYIGVGYTKMTITGETPASEWLGAVLFGLLPVTLLWHFTGVLKPVIKWFKGEAK